MSELVGINKKDSGKYIKKWKKKLGEEQQQHFNSEDYICTCCGKHFTSLIPLTVEHITPQVVLKATETMYNHDEYMEYAKIINSLDNMTLLCDSCNVEIATSLEKDFKYLWQAKKDNVKLIKDKLEPVIENYKQLRKRLYNKQNCICPACRSYIHRDCLDSTTIRRKKSNRARTPDNLVILHANPYCSGKWRRIRDNYNKSYKNKKGKN